MFCRGKMVITIIRVTLMENVEVSGAVLTCTAHRCKLALRGLAAYLLNTLQRCSSIQSTDVNKDGGG